MNSETTELNQVSGNTMTIPTIKEDEWYKRPIKCYTLTSTSTAAFDEEIDVLATWFANAYVRNKIKNIHLIKPHFKVQVTINANPTIFGGIVCAVGFGHSISGIGTVDKNNIYDLPHSIISPCSNNSVVLDVPFVYPLPYWTMNETCTGIFRFETDHGYGDNLFYPFIIKLLSVEDDPLRTSLPVFPGFSLTVEAWCEHFESAQPFAAQSGVKKKSESHDEYSKSTISKKATALAGVADKLVNIPLIGPAARATSFALNIGSDIASIFGFSRPAIDPDPTPITFRHYPDTFSATTSTNLVRLAEDFKQEIPLSGLDFAASGRDELAFDSLVDSWGIVTAGTIALNAGLTNLTSFPVTPIVTQIKNVSNFHCSRLGLVASMFTYWRGDITYRIRIDSTVYHSGTIMVLWNPNPGAAISTDTNLNEHVLIDVCGTKEVDITIRYNSNLPWMKTKAWNKAAARDTNETGGFYLGEISIVTYSPIVGPSPIRYTVFYKGEPGFQFNGPSNFCGRLRFGEVDDLVPVAARTLALSIATRGAAASTLPSANMWEPESGEKVAHVYFGSSTDTSYSVEQTQGQVFSSLRPYMKAYHPYIRAKLSTGQQHQIFDLPGCILPNYERIRTDASDIGYVVSNMINVIVPCFLGYRGAIRYFDPITSGVETSVLYNRAPKLTAAINPTTFPCGSFVASQDDWYRIMNYWTTGGNKRLAIYGNQPMSVEIPYTTRQYFLPSMNRNQFLPVMALSGVPILSHFKRPTNNVTNVIYDISIGEDFNVFMPSIVPYFTLRAGDVTPDLWTLLPTTIPTPT